MRNLYFVRVDYIYKGSPVQRVRCLVPSLTDAAKLVRQYLGHDFLVLQVKVEFCS